MASVTFSVVPSQNAVCVGDEFGVQVLVDAPEAAINAAQGTLTYDADALTMTGVQHGSSFMTFWIVPPAVPAEQGLVPFVGGLPTPGYIGTDGSVMNATFRAGDTAGDAVLTVGPDTIALLDDGRATEADVVVVDAQVSVLPATDELCAGRDATTIEVTDTEPPLPFEIDITQTEQVFDGAYFASYHTTDSESGVAYYEVMESSAYQATPWTREMSPYRLKTQSGEVQVSVRAIDNAGNERTETASEVLIPHVHPSTTGDTVLLMIAGALAVLILWHCFTQRRTEE